MGKTDSTWGKVNLLPIEIGLDSVKKNPSLKQHLSLLPFSQAQIHASAPGSTASLPGLEGAGAKEQGCGRSIAAPPGRSCPRYRTDPRYQSLAQQTQQST